MQALMQIFKPPILPKQIIDERNDERFKIGHGKGERKSRPTKQH